MMLKQMDPNTVQVIQKDKGLLDPNGIMNPGNWDLD